MTDHYEHPACNRESESCTHSHLDVVAWLRAHPGEHPTTRVARALGIDPNKLGFLIRNRIRTFETWEDSHRDRRTTMICLHPHLLH